ncbi:MAG: hypothetical protein NVSMB65_20910 [Chloroflexota bacterium]
MLFSFLLAVWSRLPPAMQGLLYWYMNPHWIISVTVVLVTDTGHVLLGEQPHKRPRWALLGGFLKRDEDPARAVLREIAEETGLRIQRPTFLHADAYGRHMALYYQVRVSPSDGVFQPSAEVVALQPYTLETLPPDLRPEHRRMIMLALAARDTPRREAP